MLTCPVCADVRVRAVDVPGGRGFVRCARCRLLFDPERTPDVARPELSERERRLEERVALRRASHFDALLRRAGGPGRVLDVGAGIGAFVQCACDAGWQAVGVDVDPAVVAYARARGRDVRLGDLSSLALEPETFDLVTLWNVLDFLREPLAALREARRVLRPGGSLFVRTPNAPVQIAGVRLTAVLAAMLRHTGGRPRWAGILHTSNFGARGLRIALGRAGFAGIDIRNSDPIAGDPYLGLGPVREAALGLAKQTIFGVAQAMAVASGGRCLLSPSLEALARRAA